MEGSVCVWGGEMGREGGHYTTTHVLFSVLYEGQLLLLSSETGPHRGICRRSLGKHNGFLKIGGHERPLAVSHFCTFKHQMLCGSP